MASQETSRVRHSKTAMKTSENKAPTGDYTLFWLIGASVLYFAIQLWILPALGIST